MPEVVEEYLDAMDDALAKAKRVPLSNAYMIDDVNALRDYITQIRANLPGEIRQASLIIQERASLISEAKKNAEGIISKAEARAAALTANDEITKKAEARAVEIEKQANVKAKAIKSATNQIVSQVLAQSEEALTGSLTQIRKMKSAVGGQGNSSPNVPKNQ